MADQNYIYDPLDARSDPDFLQADAYEFLQSQWPDWRPNESNLETWMVGVAARMVAEARDVATDVPRAIFRFYGRSVLGIPPIDPTSASVDSTWDLDSNPAGRTLVIGTTVTIDDDDGNPHEFEIINETNVPAGTLTVTDVTLRATIEGETENDLGGSGVEATNAEAIAWVRTITLQATTSNGGDGETDDDYLDRLSRRLITYGPKLVKGVDWEIMAKDIAAQNGADVRTLAIDGYNQADGTINNEGMVGVAMIDNPTGDNVSAAIKDAVSAELANLREVNFLVFMIDPTRTSIDITYAGVSKAGADPAEVKTAADAALATFTDDSNWGRTEGREWTQQTVVRHQDVSTVLNGVDGFDHWTTLTIGINGGAQVADDVSLAGIAPVGQTGVISGTVT